MPETILVVDDRPANRYVLVHALKRSGYSVMEACSGKEALELAASLPSVIVLDVKLPDILGYEVCRRIKENHSTSHIPVLQLSAAFLSDESKVHALESGADAFLTQPVEPNVLIASVKSLVRLHNAETKARILGDQWQATFDALIEGVALIDASGVIQRCNLAMSRILHRFISEIEGQTFSTLLEESLGSKLGDFALEPTQEVQLETRHLRLRLTQVVRNEITEGSIFIVSDITEQKRAQAALVVNERLAATGRMANIIAHEINNPLEAITNLHYLMGQSLGEPEAASRFLDLAQEQLLRVSRIARQILSFNRETRNPIQVAVFELLEDVLALNDREMVRKDLKLRKEWNAAVTTVGFPAQLRQVFSNLLRNAIEASYPDSEIRLKVSEIAHWGRLNEPVVRISFGDHGIGIPAENRAQIFEAFFTTKELKGSGIGLWLSSTIIQEHNGRILVRSSTRPQRSGTCISVILPGGQIPA